MWLRKVTSIITVFALAEVSAKALQAPLRVRINHKAFEKTFARHDQEMVKGLRSLESEGPHAISIATRQGVDERDYNFKLEVNEAGISLSSD